MNETCSVEMRNIYKSFGGVHALKNVSVRFRSGEIHSLVGENGAGKIYPDKNFVSMYTKDAGEVMIHGGDGKCRICF